MANRTKKLQIDPRTSEDILNDIRAKARSYVPEWHMDGENPDIGFALSRVYAKQMGENIDRLNQVIDNYHTEFINMLDISPKGARPAEGLVELSIGADTIPGTYIPKGTKLRTDGDEPIIYETQNSLYTTTSSLVSIFMVDGEDGTICPIKGKLDIPSLLPQILEEEEEPVPVQESVSFREFRIFGEEESIVQNSMYFYNGSVVDTGDNPIYIRILGGKDLKELINDKKIAFRWYSEEGLVDFAEVTPLEDGFTYELKKDSQLEAKTVMVRGQECFLIVLEALTGILEDVSVQSITFSSKGYEKPLDFATDGRMDYETEKFAPFGEELSPYAQCFMGMDSYFGKKGARITLEFDVSYRDHNYEIGVPQADSPELKIIKKKPKVRAQDIPADCVINEMSVEYYNGSGWKKLEADSPLSNMFTALNAGHYSITFTAPEDWEPTGAGAYNGRMLRFQIIQAENCFYRPCIHHFPVIQKARVSYSYEDKYLSPIMAKGIAGISVVDVTKKVYEGRKFNLFSASPYTSDALYMGFSRKFENGPISIMFDIEELFTGEELKYMFEYSSGNGFRQMKVMDSTRGMTRTGLVSFLPPPDMVKTTVEGKYLYWIRLVRNKVVTENKKNLPIVKNIRPNVVRVANINVLEEREIYIDEISTNQVIPLYETDILDVDLWVNEYDSINRYELENLKISSPDDVIAEYDMAGNMRSCFVRYEECSSFQFAPHKRVYILDRINGLIRFGDGIKTYTLRMLDDVAARLTIRKSQGTQGNTESGTIREAVGNLLFVDYINNPKKIYNGSDMENVESVMERGSLMLQSRGRLLSAEDYKKEIRLYNDGVSEIEIICEDMKNGKKDPLAVTCVLLLKDYGIDHGAFYQIAEGIKKHLLANCELTVSKDNLHVVNPIFVDISVDIWVESMNIDESFELQNLLKEDLERYLDPTNGWKIGTLPKPSQILMRLNVLKNRAIIRKSVIVAKYTDQNGKHEMDIKNVKVTPFMICRSGEHNVHIILSD